MRNYEEEYENEDLRNENLRDKDEVMRELKEYWIGKEIKYIEFFDVTDYSTKEMLDYKDLEDGKHIETLQGSYAHDIEELPRDPGYLQNVIFYFETVGEYEVIDEYIDEDTLTIKVTNIDTI